MRLDEVVKAIVKDAGDKYELNSDEMIFKHTVNNISVMYVINSVGGYKDKSTNLIISDYIDFNIFLQID